MYYYYYCSIGVRGQHEGLVHVSQLRQEGRVKDVNDVVKRGQRVKVKLLGITGSKMSLSMKVRIDAGVTSRNFERGGGGGGDL